MSRTPTLSLAALFTCSVLLLASAGCGGDSQEQELEKATAALAEAREAVEEARAAVEIRQQTVDEATAELEAAQAELRDRKRSLTEAEARVGLTATDATLFRSVQRRLLEEDSLADWAIAAEVSKGVVTLQGAVADDKARARAEELARLTPGVVEVKNRIEVQSPPTAE